MGGEKEKAVKENLEGGVRTSGSMSLPAGHPECEPAELGRECKPKEVEGRPALS